MESRIVEHRSIGWLGLALLAAGAVPAPMACGPDEPNDLSRIAAHRVEDLVRIKGYAFKVWVADEPDERERGLMFVTKEQMARLEDGTERGMLFVFPTDQSAWHGFWMRNTIIPLDIAFIRADGTIVSTDTMAPLDERPYYPQAPYRYALEVNANVFARLGIGKGDRAEIPDALLKQAG